MHADPRRRPQRAAGWRASLKVDEPQVRAGASACGPRREVMSEPVNRAFRPRGPRSSTARREPAGSRGRKRRAQRQSSGSEIRHPRLVGAAGATGSGCRLDRLPRVPWKPDRPPRRRGTAQPPSQHPSQSGAQGPGSHQGRNSTCPGCRHCRPRPGRCSSAQAAAGGRQVIPGPRRGWGRTGCCSPGAARRRGRSSWGGAGTRLDPHGGCAWRPHIHVGRLRVGGRLARRQAGGELLAALAALLR